MNKYNQLVPNGLLRTQGVTYFLIHSMPLPSEWEFGGFERRFLVVPVDYVDVDFVDNKQARNIYPCPRAVVVTDYMLEYSVDISPILCKRPVDILDTLFENMSDKQGALK